MPGLSWGSLAEQLVRGAFDHMLRVAQALALEQRLAIMALGAGKVRILMAGITGSRIV